MNIYVQFFSFLLLTIGLETRTNHDLAISSKDMTEGSYLTMQQLHAFAAVREKPAFTKMRYTFDLVAIGVRLQEQQDLLKIESDSYEVAVAYANLFKTERRDFKAVIQTISGNISRLENEAGFLAMRYINHFGSLQDAPYITKNPQGRYVIGHPKYKNDATLAQHTVLSLAKEALASISLAEVRPLAFYND